MTRIYVRVAAVAVATAMLTACATQGPPPGPAATPTVPPQSPEATPTGSEALGDGPAVLDDGRHPVFLTQIDVPQKSIKFDLVVFLTGAAAKTEWLKQHPEEPDGPPNDYLIVNNNPKLRTLPVAADVVVKIVNPDAPMPLPLVAIPFAELTTHYESRPFWITIKGETVTAIEEQFLP